MSERADSGSVASMSGTGSADGSGGTRRFIVAALITTAVLVGSAWGLLAWIQATNQTDYDGPAKIVYPEHRYYR